MRNVYDDERFFGRYAKRERSRKGLIGAGLALEAVVVAMPGGELLKDPRHGG